MGEKVKGKVNQLLEQRKRFLSEHQLNQSLEQILSIKITKPLTLASKPFQLKRKVYKIQNWRQIQSPKMPLQRNLKRKRETQRRAPCKQSQKVPIMSCQNMKYYLTLLFSTTA